MNCSGCQTELPSGTRFCPMCGTPVSQSAAGGPARADGGTLACEVCSRPYKTRRGLDAHMASAHPDRVAPTANAPAGPWASPVPEPDDLTVLPGTWASPPGPAVTPPPPPPSPPGGVLPPPPPPPGAYPSPPPGPLPAFTPAPDPAGDWVYAAADPTTTMAPVPHPPAGDFAPPGPPEEPQTAIHLYRTIAGLGRAISATFSLLVIALLLTAAANAFMFIAAEPDHRWFEWAVRIDERMFLALPILVVIAVANTVVILIWLYRAVANQQSFGAERLRLRPVEALALAFVPLVNLFTIKMAMADIWRTADPRAVPGDRWRHHTPPGRLKLIWLGPLLAGVINGVIGVVVENRLDRDGLAGVTDLAEAKFLYAGRGISMLVFLLVVNSLRKIYQDTTDRQELAYRQIRDGGARNFQRYTGTNPASPYAARTA